MVPAFSEKNADVESHLKECACLAQKKASGATLRLALLQCRIDAL